MAIRLSPRSPSSSRLVEEGPGGLANSEIITMSAQKSPDTNDGAIKDPTEWTTGDEPMTGAQESYLNTLASEAGEEVEPDLSKAEASKRIDELQDKTGRG